jgi:hypothetical protein
MSELALSLIILVAFAAGAIAGYAFSGSKGRKP